MRGDVKIQYRAVLALATVLLLTALSARAQFFMPPQTKPKPLVILDPGHGGADLGARTSKNYVEKDFTLRLARAVKDRLEQDGAADALLTRETDRELSPLARLEFVNARKAGMFISLHADGGAKLRSHPLKIFIHKPEPANAAPPPGPWDRQGDPYAPESGKLAATMAPRLESAAGRKVEIAATSLMGLGGAGMPAALVEAADFSNPEDAIRVEDDAYLAKLADAVAGAVMEYLRVKGARNP
ncbi:MAG: N-acetylmuramoyl-L-alanine amidase [Nitrospinae bacterium]|nr:N-acetylmuramoyl-L-alanine amidase [Nitrospinota bacterium]